MRTPGLRAHTRGQCFQTSNAGARVPDADVMLIQAHKFLQMPAHAMRTRLHSLEGHPKVVRVWGTPGLYLG